MLIVAERTGGRLFGSDYNSYGGGVVGDVRLSWL